MTADSRSRISLESFWKKYLVSESPRSDSNCLGFVIFWNAVERKNSLQQYRILEKTLFKSLNKSFNFGLPKWKLKWHKYNQISESNV